MNLAELFKDSAYKLTQFKPDQIAAFQAGITQKDTGETPALYFNCLVRGKPPSSKRKLQAWRIWCARGH